MTRGGTTSDPEPVVVLSPEVATIDNLNNRNYRCPVCGEMADASRAEQILLHHEHVTHPRNFLLAKAVAA